MENNSNNNGWSEYKQRVFYQLDELTKKTDIMNEKLDKLTIDFTVVKTKVGTVGAIIALIVTIITNIVIAFASHGKV